MRIPKTPLAKMIAHLLSAGAEPDAIVSAVEVVELHAIKQRAGRSRKRASAANGTRLADDWRPSDADMSFALDRGMPRDRVAIEAEKFRNYWTAKSGAGATKRDWPATWRNWILSTMEWRNERPSNNNRQRFGTDSTAGRTSGGADAILAGMARLARPSH